MDALFFGASFLAITVFFASLLLAAGFRVIFLLDLMGVFFLCLLAMLGVYHRRRGCWEIREARQRRLPF